MKSQLRLNLIRVGVLALSGGIPLIAGAQSATLYGGGATLPALLYVGSVGSLPPTLVNPPAASSLFDAYQTHLGGPPPVVSYCQTGSGGGKKVLDGVVAASVTCGPSGTVGFSATGTYPSFAASDAPILLSEYQAFQSNANTPTLVSVHTEPEQFPSAAGAIAIVYNNPDTSSANLTDADICGVFNGTFTNWNQLSGAYPSRPITIVYRSDGSGTTFNFSNHLAAACNTTSSVKYNTSQNFISNAAGGSFFVIPSGAVPTGALGGSGNNGVVDTVNSVTGAIGYAEAANAKARIAADGGSSTTFNYAKVNGKDPFANMPYPVSANLLPADQVITGAIPSGTSHSGEPLIKTLTSQSVTVAVPGCVVIADPQSYAKQSSGYPIVGVTYLLGYESGNGADTHNIRSLLASPYNATVLSGVSTIVPGSGFAPLALTDTNGNPVDPVDAELQIAGCVNN